MKLTFVMISYDAPQLKFVIECYSCHLVKELDVDISERFYTEKEQEIYGIKEPGQICWACLEKLEGTPEQHNKRSCKTLTTPVLAPKNKGETDVKVKPVVKVEMNMPTKTNYPNLEALDRLCKSFVGKKIYLTACFNGRSLPIMNPNLVGDLLEDIFYPFYKDAFPDFEKGPRQESPDFFVHGQEFQFEQKVFYESPGFDISNFTSLVHQMSKPGGLVKKLFKTKYLVYEYSIDEGAFVIKKFWMLNIWNLPTYDNTYPISMQVKKKMWYNIRPGVTKSWVEDSKKTPAMFLDKLLQCIERCPHLEDKESLKSSIVTQIGEAKLQGFL